MGTEILNGFKITYDMLASKVIIQESSQNLITVHEI